MAVGEIVDGQLRVIAPSIPLAIPLMGAVLSLTINDANVTGSITDTTITNGVIGGAISRDDMLDLVGTFLPGDPATVAGIVDILTDLKPDAAGTCQGLSMGITYGAVEATF
jgi:hypothetical protein